MTKTRSIIHGVIREVDKRKVLVDNLGEILSGKLLELIKRMIPDEAKGHQIRGVVLFIVLEQMLSDVWHLE